jgi:hypothetical protein
MGQMTGPQRFPKYCMVAWNYFKTLRLYLAGDLASSSRFSSLSGMP